MKVTLYIDESGDFSSSIGAWLIGGLLIALPFHESEKLLGKHFLPIIKELGYEKIQDFHLTEIRQNRGHLEAQRVVQRFFSELESLNIPYWFLTTINKTKKGMSIPERTYRLMVLDLLQQSENTIADLSDSEFQSLDLVIATRTINNIRQTEDTHIKSEVIQPMVLGLESDLVALGKISLLGNNLQIHMHSAKYYWGLVNADFICNLTYNAKRDNANERILAELSQNGRLFSYETFSSPELRRVTSQMMNQNYPMAMFNALRLLLKNSKNSEQYKEVLFGLFDKSFRESGTKGSKINFEMLLELIWRSKRYFARYEEKIIVYRKLVDMLKVYYEKSYPLADYHRFIFQTYNLILLCLNHTAQVDDGREIIQFQKSIIPEFINDPSMFSYILDFYLREVEIYVNDLDYDTAKLSAEQYLTLVQEYQSMWELLQPNFDKEEFKKSSIFIKAKSNALRCRILGNIEKADGFIQDSDFKNLTALVSNSLDLSRLNAQQCLILLKQHEFEKAFDLMKERVSSRDANAFDLFFVFFTFNQACLLNKSNPNFRNQAVATLKMIIQQQEQYIKKLVNYPNTVLQREVSLFYHFMGEKRKALEYLKLSDKNRLVGTAKITVGLKLINQMLFNLYEGKKEIDSMQESEYIALKQLLAFLEKYKHVEEKLFELRAFLTS